MHKNFNKKYRTDKGKFLSNLFAKINLYAPTKKTGDERREKFYQEINKKSLLVSPETRCTIT